MRGERSAENSSMGAEIIGLLCEGKILWTLVFRTPPHLLSNPRIKRCSFFQIERSTSLNSRMTHAKVPKASSPAFLV